MNLSLKLYRMMFKIKFIMTSSSIYLLIKVKYNCHELNVFMFTINYLNVCMETKIPLGTFKYVFQSDTIFACFSSNLQ